ncbi:hypothetical protein [Gordonia crocea]|uniref:Di-and tripeptidase n=1 Tax=Gordonia crocea TaxID=589162 RepID=A0A7I9UW64_9ACTN|nr:hypothetical protein [Gordonia crocea]GED97418.1 hypothetical protein nbrc107697_14570 [Gordonia crocea]
MRKRDKNLPVPADPIAGDGVETPRPSAQAVGAADKMLRRAQRLQGPAVAKYVAKIRAAHPEETPEQIIGRLEKQYLLAVTGSGGAVGATAAVPGVGTIAALSAVAGESLFFLEASALLALAVAEVHGIDPDDQQRRESLVLSVALGEEGLTALGKLVGTGRSGALRQLSIGSIPGANLSSFNRKMLNKVMRKFTLKRAPIIVGKLLPAGVGATIGAVGNRALGKRIVDNSRAAFGPAPRHWPTSTVIDGSVVDPALPAPRLGLPTR